jgi:hypothetical protein
MSFQSAANHEPGELEYVSADDINNLVTFRAVSRSGANGGYNYASLDVASGEWHCSCKGAATGRECWHASLLQAAWDAHPARVLASRYTTAQLLAAGTKAARMVRVYRRRGFRVLPADQVALVAARSVYLERKRAALAAAPAAA